jgi:hypothetical protein
MRYLIGIDDTDNLESRGTGHRARQLRESLETAGLASIDGITRHQLLVDPAIPYTSHNSSACLLAEIPEGRLAEVIALSRDYLLRESAEGSDAGLCVAPWSAVGPDLRNFGFFAKHHVLKREAALRMARETGVFLEGLTGTGGGVIGSLAAVGLRVVGNDGRFLWLRGARDLEGVFTAEELYRTTAIEEIRSLQGPIIPPSTRVNTSPWPRPVLIDGRAVLLVEEAPDKTECDWNIAPKEVIKRY